MTKYLSILLLLTSVYAQSQELDRTSALINKIKQVRIIYFNKTSDTVEYNYDVKGLLINIKQKPSPYIYPKEASRITSFYYTDTLLKMKLVKTFIRDTLFKTDSVLYDYDNYNRLVSIYSSYVDNVPRLQLNIYNDPKKNLDISSLIRTNHYEAYEPRYDTLSVPTVTVYGKTFYLQDFQVHAGSNINYYTKCLTKSPADAQAFCKSKLDRVKVQGDSIRQTITISTGYTDLGFRNEMLFDDSAYFYFGDHDLRSVTTEKLSQGKVLEKNIFEYDVAYPWMCKNSTTSTFTYNNLGLLTLVKSNDIFYIHPKDQPVISEGTINYEYLFYDK